MATVTLTDVGKVYEGGVVAVKDVNLSIKDGEFVVLVGPSGCGKSTTLRMVAGLEEISMGEIKIDERIVNDVAPKDRDIAMVFQNYALYPHMSVYDNMAFGLKLRKEKKSEIHRRVTDAARILGLEPYLDRRPKALSGGQRQRVAMGRAIVRNPAVFLFDEPLSNLDAKMRVEMRKEILQLHRRLKSTMIYVTHDQVEAMTLGDRIVVMKDGLVQQAGEPGEVFDHPVNTFVAGFIGTPPMNLMPGRYENGEIILETGVRLPLGGAHRQAMDGCGKKEVYWGIRPKAFSLANEDTPAGASRITAMVDVLEMLGEEISAHLRLGETPFVMTADPHERARFGDTVDIVPDMERCHVFCKESGKRLT